MTLKAFNRRLPTLIGGAVTLVIGAIVLDAGAAARASTGCTASIAAQLPAQGVTVTRGGRQLTGTEVTLRRGDQVAVTSGRFTLAFQGSAYSFDSGSDFSLACKRELVFDLSDGAVQVQSGKSGADSARVITPQALVVTSHPDTNLVVQTWTSTKRTIAQTRNWPIVIADTADQRMRITAQVSYTALDDSRGLRLNVWPFSLQQGQRTTDRADALPAYWADGSNCAVGCHAAAAIDGWPLKPFHQPHTLQAGFTDFRPSGFHVGIDVQAANNEPVYAIESGRAKIRYPASTDVNVDVGSFDYWHIKPAVRNGQRVTAYRTVIGTVLWGQHHIDVSEGPAAHYLNPLRPGGSLRPFSNTIAPLIATPRIYAGGDATVAVFDPQNIITKGPYLTPVITPAAIAWRLYNARGRALTGLEWALRGSHFVAPKLVRRTYAAGAYAPGWDCYAYYRRCIPNFDYRLAGGQTGALPLKQLKPGRYRLTVYAWNYAGRTSALDDWFTAPLTGLAREPSGGPIYGNCPTATACQDRRLG